MKANSIPLFKVYMSEKAPDAVAEVLRSGFIGEGPQVKAFEQELKSYFRANDTHSKIVLVNSATSAEHLIYHMLKSNRVLTQKYEWGASETFWPALKATDEVLTTALTCTATNWPIVHNNLNLRWVDVDPLTLNMSLEDLERKINVNTRIVTVVHWGGNPMDMDKLEAIVRNAEKLYGRPIAIIEDCAHSFGGKYADGTPIGFRGNFATFSLQAIKHITSGDGGFFVTPYDSIEEQAKLLRWYGIDREGPRADFRCEADVPEAGFKFHMNDISAAIGRCNLAEANNITTANQSNGAYYTQALKDVEGITLIPEVGQSAYWLYSLHAERRDDLMRYLAEHGVASSRVHERNDKHSCMLPYWSKLPGVDQAVKTMLSIPVGYWVSQEDREYIVELIKKGW